jgi:hypothetical protein
MSPPHTKQAAEHLTLGLKDVPAFLCEQGSFFLLQTDADRRHHS